ncbi:hypothetical protein ACFLU6_13875, partial [Acidobacteriota bacterium]
MPQDSAWESFLIAHPGTWHRRLDLRTGRPSMVWGKGIPWIPGNGNSLAWEQAPTLDDMESMARAFMEASPDLFSVEQGDLVLNTSRSVRLTDGTVWFVDFDFKPHGISAQGARVFFRVNHGNVIQMGSHGIVDTPELEIQPSISNEAALDKVLQKVKKVYPNTSRIIDSGSLVYLPQASDVTNFNGSPGNGLDYRLTYRVSFKQAESLATWIAFVDAQSGDILALYDGNAYQCNPVLLERAKVTGGIFPYGPADTEEIRAFPHTLVLEDANAIVTDYNGIYSYQGGTAESGLNGQYVDMNCTGCSNPAQAYISNVMYGDLHFGTGGIDAAGNGWSTPADRNTFYHANLMRAMGAKWLGLPWFDDILPANVNIPSTCNAFWDGTSINFYSSGNGCGNTGEISGVIYHEWGHGIDQNSGYDNDGARGEAIGDTVAVLINHRSEVGAGFFNDNSGIRELDENISDLGLLTVSNVTSLCPGGNGPLGAEVHCEGELMGQTLWRLAQSLVAKYGEIGGWYTAERLFFGSLPGSTTYLGNQAGSQYDAYVAVDDDNGDLTDGTPNATEINDAFVAHEIQTDPVVGSSTPCTPPASPTLSAVHQLDPVTGTYQVYLTWNIVTGASFYNVYRSEKELTGSYIPVAQNLVVNDYLDDNVTNGLTYYYIVLAVDANACVSRDDTAVSVILDLAELGIDSFQIDDSSGNGNGAVEPGEQIVLPLTLANLGVGDTTNVVATLTTSATGFVTIQTDTATFGNIPGLGTGATSDPHFSFDVDPDLANCEKTIPFLLTIESDQRCWWGMFELAVGNARTDLLFEGVTLDDFTPTGNGNGILDPGEQANLVVDLRNAGSNDSANTTALLSTAHPGVTVDVSTAQFGTIPAGSSQGTQTP